MDVMERKKETAVTDYINFTKKSWTWKRLTDKERDLFLTTMKHYDEQGIIKGTYTARWRSLQSLYSMFLAGCGYTGGNWRD